MQGHLSQHPSPVVCAVRLRTRRHLSAARADPPTPVAANADAAAPTIATVTLQPVAPSDNGVAPAVDPGRGIRFEDLPNGIGLRVRVLTRNQREHVGVIRGADARDVILSVNQHGGSATYVLSREQIRIDRFRPGKPVNRPAASPEVAAISERWRMCFHARPQCDLHRPY